MIGGLAGILMAFGKSINFERLKGTTGASSEYFNGVSEQEKRRHLLQEARIMGSSGITVRR